MVQMVTAVAELVAAVLVGYAAWLQIRTYRRNRRP